MVDRVFTLLVAPLVIAVAIGGWWMVLRRCLRGEPVLRYENRRPPPWGLVDILLALMLMFVFSVAALSLAAGGVEPPAGDDSAAPSIGLLLAGSAANLAAIVVSLGAIKLRTGASWKDLGFEAHTIAGDIKLGLITFAMTAPIVYAIQLILVEWLELQYDQPLIELLRASPTWPAIAVTAFAAVIAAPFAEEVFFRALLLGWLEKAATGRLPPADVLLGSPQPPIEVQYAAASDAPDSKVEPAMPSRWRLTAALLVSAALFALVHASQGLAPTIPLFVFALALGFLYQRTHRLLPCIIVHFCLNALTTIVLLIEVL